MARQDPSRPIRSLFTREFLALIRNARSRALAELQPLLRRTNLEAGEVLKILEMLNLAYIDQPGRQLIQRYILQAYKGGIGDTHNILLAQVKSPTDLIKISLNFTRPDERAIANLSATSFADLAGFTTEMSKKIVRDLVELDKKGAGITKMSAAIQQGYLGIGAARAEAIARTTTTQAYNQAAWSRIGEYAPYKEWIPTLTDSRTRPSHLAMKGVIIDVDQPFDVPAYRASINTRVPACQMMFPGDSSLGAPAAQIIQCRCAVVPRFLKK
jgi:SPP1 gp7 family putative phage head morphogenesis protein